MWSDLLRREGWFLGVRARPRSSSWWPTSPPRESSIAAACAIAPFLASATCSTPAHRDRRDRSRSRSGLFLVRDQRPGRCSPTAIRIVVLVVTAGLAPTVARLREERERRIHDLTRVARVAQDAVLTPVPPTSGALRLASAYESASREALIGGDLFAVVSTGRETRLLVGRRPRQGARRRQDRGDGARPASASRPTRRRRCSELAAHCDGRLQPHLGDEDFVTAMFAAIDDDGRVELVSYGHPAPVLTHGSDASGPSTSPSPAGRSGSPSTPTSRSRSGCSSIPATACCSSPTAWPRHATGTATSSTCASS